MRVGIPLALALLAAPALAQEPIEPLTVARFGWEGEDFLANRSELAIWLNRAPSARDGVALVIGRLDLSALLDRTGNMIRYRPQAVRLPAGEADLVVYRIDSTGAWTEIGRHPLKVRGAAGLERARAAPAADLSSSGLLDRSGAATASERRGYQDVSARLGLELSGAGRGYSVTGQVNLLGVSHETLRLRWSGLGRDAPAVDLADYRVGATVGRTAVTLGAVSVGVNRHLLNGFGSRGLTAGLPLGSALQLDLGLVAGTSMVGWSNLTGLADARHRIGVATLAVQLVPSRPGALELDLTGVDGSVRPASGFNQGAATDAEESRGYGIGVTASDARQRVRFAAGLSRSRFTNPADPLLARDSTVVAVRPTTRTARYGELTIRVLDGAALAPSLPASLAVTARHERVDPLYRSVGAFVAADQHSNGAELGASLGALTLQAGLQASRDNLEAIASILTTRTRGASWSAALPLASLLGARPAWYWPAVAIAWQRTRQFGDGVPVNGDFQASHVPDQVSVNRTGSLTWSAGATTVTYRWNRSTQDNRQVGRERADFSALVHGLTVTGAARRDLTLGIDLGLERNRSQELALTQRVERIGLNLQWQPAPRTALSGALSALRGEDPRSDQRTRQTELYGELSQGFNLYRRPDGGSQGRVFVRYGRTRAAVATIAGADPFVPTVVWTLTAGSSLRAF